MAQWVKWLLEVDFQNPGGGRRNLILKVVF